MLSVLLLLLLVVLLRSNLIMVFLCLLGFALDWMSVSPNILAPWELRLLLSFMVSGGFLFHLQKFHHALVPSSTLPSMRVGSSVSVLRSVSLCTSLPVTLSCGFTSVFQDSATSLQVEQLARPYLGSALYVAAWKCFQGCKQRITPCISFQASLSFVA